MPQEPDKYILTVTQQCTHVTSLHSYELVQVLKNDFELQKNHSNEMLRLNLSYSA